MIYLLYCLVLHMLSGNYCCFCIFLLKRARMFSSYSRSCSKAQHQHYGEQCQSIGLWLAASMMVYIPGAM